MHKKNLYKVIFRNQNKVYELYAKKIFQSEMMGFVEVESLIFGETSKLLVDPNEEKLAAEFAGVERIFVPMQHIIRIDEVKQKGKNKITVLDGGVQGSQPTV
jgi:hypothetical protein